MRTALVAVVACGWVLTATLPRLAHAQPVYTDLTTGVPTGLTTGLAPTALPAPPAEFFAGPWPRELLTWDQIGVLVGPIALYPDPLLAQVLPASTYPFEIVKAARMLRAGADEAQILASDFDASISALVRYPEVISLMDEHLEWTERLGQAFIEQPDEVLLAVQRLREIARQHGNLTTTQHQEVLVEREYIRIVPVTEYIYVPYYQPSVVYYHRCPPTTTFITFRSRSYIGSWFDLDCDWNRRTICRRDGWSWRDYTPRQTCPQTGVTITVNHFDDHYHARPVHDWACDPHRRGHPRGDRDRRDFARDHGRNHDRNHNHNHNHDHDRGRRSRDDDRRSIAPPRAAEPNPPVIVAPPPPQPPAQRPRAAPPASPPIRNQPRTEATPRIERRPIAPESPTRPIPDATPAPRPEVQPAPPTLRPSRPGAKPQPPAAKPDRPIPRPTEPSITPRPAPKPKVEPKPVNKPAPAPKPAVNPTPPKPKAAPAAPPLPKAAAPSPPVISAPKPSAPAPRPEARPIAAPKPQPAPRPTAPIVNPAPKPAPKAAAPIQRPASKAEAQPAPRPTPAPAPKAATKPAPKPTPAQPKVASSKAAEDSKKKGR